MSEIPNNKEVLKDLKYIRRQTWDEVFNTWQSNEDGPGFKRVYLDRGYADWQAWRNTVVQRLHLDELDWSLYDVQSPAITVPSFHGGPFKPWIERYYDGANEPTFEQIIKFPGTDIQSRRKFVDIIKASKDVDLVGLLKDKKIYIIEGMHRCVAITLAASRNKSFNASVRISLANSNLSHFPMEGETPGTTR
ncbi:hypothetical protein A3A68_02460 [Candidatus Saccharibacteria bacterium RIFCSPLOWO2_01_FULL_48_13]|nr:MAG: hypothetical protein A3A68_02460 [Candidatus Saccharibacteria bacterium RIFCSPLOWO2_01_FULL_48_13]